MCEMEVATGRGSGAQDSDEKYREGTKRQGKAERQEIAMKGTEPNKAGLGREMCRNKDETKR